VAPPAPAAAAAPPAASAQAPAPEQMMVIRGGVKKLEVFGKEQEAK
jgi:hypothetical protein